MSRHRSQVGEKSFRGLIAVMSLLAAGAIPAAARDGAAEDAGVALWDAVGVSSARSVFSSDTKALRVALASGDHASFTRRIGASPGTAFRCVFDLAVTGVPADGSVRQVFRLGSEFDASNADAPEASTYARLSLDADPSGFRLSDPTASGDERRFSGTQAVTWALNDAGRVLTYTAPDGTTRVLANDRMDVWVGRTRVIGDASVATPDRAISDLKWYWAAGSGTTTVDHFAIAPLQGDDDLALPSPSTDATTEAAAVTPQETDPAATPLELYRPSPNPFERTTHFAYEVSAGTEAVDIGVFDLSGRRIRTLIQAAQTAGRYEVAWDGRGQDGASSRHGIYFLRANVGTTHRTARLVYLFQ